MEYLFILDDELDPAKAAIAGLLSEPTCRHVSARILVASRATANSQKIHKCVAPLRSRVQGFGDLHPPELPLAERADHHQSSAVDHPLGFLGREALVL